MLCLRPTLLISLLFNACAALAYEPLEETPGKALDPIKNGSPAIPAAQPWVASFVGRSTNATLQNSDLQFCTGSLIAPQWVITAAHCMVGATPADFQIILGRDFIDSPGGEVHQPAEVIINPYFDDVSNPGDVALVRLTVASKITPIPLADDNFIVGNPTATLFGWGSTVGRNRLPCTVQFIESRPTNAADYRCETSAFRNPNPTKQLQTGVAQVLSATACTQRYIALLKHNKVPVPPGLEEQDISYPDMLCIGDPNNIIQLCFGDSGGPVLVEQNGRQVLAGIGSFLIGPSCEPQFALAFFSEIKGSLWFIQQALASNQALSFAELCPKITKPTVTYSFGSNGLIRTRIRWTASAKAKGYGLFYMPVPATPANIAARQQVPVAASATEYSIDLPRGRRYLVALQAKGQACDSALSDYLEVTVP